MEILKQFAAKLKSGLPFPGVNKYTIAILVFCIWLGFVDRYSMINQFKLSRTLNRLESAKVEYEEQLEEALKERQTINKNIEKFAREKYLFHKENEKVILIED
ncbi:MAG: hypothetical protein ACO3M5_01900 [Saprospiraceae bacterium]|jgi:cell division protein DivIC|nr:hypothetical protein [Chitinophagia bacterium]